MLQLFQTKKGSFFHRQLVYSSCIAFPYIMHCIHLSHFFGASSENIFPIYSLMTARLRLFHTETLFSPLKYTVYKCYSCFRQRRGHFFYRHTCIQWLHSSSLNNALYTHVTLFWCLIRKYLSHTLYCAQPVSVCFTVKVCFCL